MPLHYILDGFNIVKKSEFSKISFNFSDPKVSLINFIRYNKPCGSRRNTVTVVFDGKPDFAFKDRYRDIQIIFGNSMCADDKIREIVEKDKNPGNIIVVSDDSDLCASVRLRGGRVMGVDSFILKGKRKDTAIARIPKVEISLTQAHRITEELRRIWLKD